MLPPHHPYDLKIDLEEGTLPPNRMYSLSQSELDTLNTFIEDHVNIGFICPSKSPHGAPVLFIKKRTVAFSFALITAASITSLKKTVTPYPS